MVVAGVRFILFTVGGVQAASDLVKGISYGPLPCKERCYLNQDDFMSAAAKPLWGPRGRGDLQVMRQLGANLVRLYGNNPDNDHNDFLDESRRVGLGVAAGISDYPYIQGQGNCMSSNFNCFEQVRAAYKLNLQNGFLTEESEYHPALREVIVVNEPDLKLPGIFRPDLFCRSAVSAIDAMLEAEKDMNVVGPLINFTVTFSFAICSSCRSLSSWPALGQMAALRDALLRPESVGYTAKNDLAAFYRTRFAHSFNTANPARDIRPMFLDHYEREFPTVPVTIMEYHKPGYNVKEDLRQILRLAEGSPVLRGVSFFEFHVRYDKGGSEMDFGMFALGDYSIHDFDYFGSDVSAWCLVPQVEGGERLPEAVAAAYGGRGLDFGELCLPDPGKVKLDAAGYALIAEQKSTQRMATFIGRVLSRLGGEVGDAAGLDALALRHSSDVGDDGFGGLVAELSARPAWTRWPPGALCLADRDATPIELGQAIGWACGNMHFNCSLVPVECTGSGLLTADFVFGTYFAEHGASPLENCYFGGAARLVVDRPTVTDPRCAVEPRRLGEHRPGGEGVRTFSHLAAVAGIFGSSVAEALPVSCFLALLGAAAAALAAVAAASRQPRMGRGAAVHCAAAGGTLAV